MWATIKGAGGTREKAPWSGALARKAEGLPPPRAGDGARERSVVDVAVKAQPSRRRGGGELGGGSLAAQQGSQQKHSRHRRPGQKPFVEGLLALPHLGSSIVPIEVHKALPSAILLDPGI